MLALECHACGMQMSSPNPDHVAQGMRDYRAFERCDSYRGMQPAPLMTPEDAAKLFLPVESPCRAGWLEGWRAARDGAA